MVADDKKGEGQAERQPERDGKKDPRNDARDQRELDAARGGHFHRAPTQPRVATPHGPWAHMVRVDGYAFGWYDTAGPEVEFCVLDTEGRIIAAARVNSYDAATMRVQWEKWEAELPRRAERR